MLCFSNPVYRMEFAKLGGVLNIVKLIKYNPKMDPEEQEHILTYMDYLHDILTETNGGPEVSSALIKAAKKAGIEQSLSPFLESEDKECVEVAERLRTALMTGYQKASAN